MRVRSASSRRAALSSRELEIANDACRAIMEVQLDTGVPIANGILTCDTDEQAEIRTQPKGSDCAQAAVEMANLQKALLQ